MRILLTCILTAALVLAGCATPSGDPPADGSENPSRPPASAEPLPPFDHLNATSFACPPDIEAVPTNEWQWRYLARFTSGAAHARNQTTRHETDLAVGDEDCMQFVLNVTSSPPETATYRVAIHLSEELRLVSGDLTWEGPLEYRDVLRLNFTVRAVSEGPATIRPSVEPAGGAPASFGHIVRPR